MTMKNFILKYRRLLVIFTHLILIIAAYLLSFYIRFEFKLPVKYLPIILKTLPLLILIKIVIFYYFDLFSGLWRYVSMDDLWRILKATSLSSIGFTLAVVFIFGLSGYPRSVFILDWILCIGFIAGVRFLSRGFREGFRTLSRERKKETLIVGAGEAGILVLRECRNNPHMNTDVVGFIDDDLAKRHLRIQGIKVRGNRKEIPDIVKKYGIEEIIIAIPSAKGEVIRDIISYCQGLDIKTKIVPGLHKIISGELEIKLREVRPEDLLGRETVQIDEREVKSYLKDKRVLITGAAGSIGSELCKQIAGFSPRQLILFDYNENDMYFLEIELREKYPNLSFKTIIGDVKDINLLKYTFSNFKPQIVFHAAAFKHVPLMEENPSAAVKNNVIATRDLIYVSKHYGVENLVFISTDKAVNPTSVMGATKRIGEMILQAEAKKSQTKFIAVRFGNVLGSKGSVVPLFQKQIAEGGPITVTHPETRRYFMGIKEAVQLVLQASALGKKGEIFILDMGEQIKIIDLAKDFITLSGLTPHKDIPIKFVGLRPGEKLSEKLLHDAEHDKATKHDKIYITQPQNFNAVKLNRDIKKLEKLANLMAEDRIIEKMNKMVPSYFPNRSQKTGKTV